MSLSCLKLDFEAFKYWLPENIRLVLGTEALVIHRV